VVATQPRLKSDRAQRKLEEITEYLDQDIARLEEQMRQGHTDVFLEAMDFWSKFYQYSYGNQRLIRWQNPNATAVAGRKRLEALGYHIKVSERGIAIRAPWLVNDADKVTGEILGKKLIGFFPTYVWDITQTAEYYTLGVPRELEDPYGEVDWPELYTGFLAAVRKYGFQVSEHPLGRAYGVAIGKSSIKINAQLNEAQKVAVLVHELCHLMAGHYGGQHKVQERHAETVSYVVCQRFGVTNAGSRDYLLSYRVEEGELKGDLEIVSRLVKQVLGVLNGPLEVRRERENQGGHPIQADTQPGDRPGAGSAGLRDIAAAARRPATPYPASRRDLAMRADAV